MKCPFCGAETPTRICRKCHGEISLAPKASEPEEVKKPKRNSKKETKEGRE